MSAVTIMEVIVGAVPVVATIAAVEVVAAIAAVEVVVATVVGEDATDAHLMNNFWEKLHR